MKWAARIIKAGRHAMIHPGVAEVLILLLGNRPKVGKSNKNVGDCRQTWSPISRQLNKFFLDYSEGNYVVLDHLLLVRCRYSSGLRYEAVPVEHAPFCAAISVDEIVRKTIKLINEVAKMIRTSMLELQLNMLEFQLSLGVYWWTITRHSCSPVSLKKSEGPRISEPGFLH